MKVFDTYTASVEYSAIVAKEQGIDLALEFGVASGTTINIIASHVEEVHGFDSFEGLPEFWRPGFDKGMFAQEIPEISGNVNLHVGWFDETLPVFVGKHSASLSKNKLIHIDCDLYSSTVTILNNLSEHLKSGDIICFDEFFGYPGWFEHEAKAWSELTEIMGISSELLAVGPEQAVFRL